MEVDAAAADERRRRALSFEEAYLSAGRFARMVRAEAEIARIRAHRQRRGRRAQ